MPLRQGDGIELRVVWQYQIDQLSKELDRLNDRLSRLEYHHEKRDVKDALKETTSLRKKYDRLGKSLEKKWMKSVPRISGVNPYADSYSFALLSMMNQVKQTAEAIKKTEDRLAEALKAF